MDHSVKKRKFLFDLIASQPNESGAYHGGGKYAKKVFFEFVEHYDAGKWNVCALFDSSRPLDGEINEQAARNNIELIDIVGTNLPGVVRELSIERFYSALPLGTIPYGFNDLLGSECEIYGTIHGLRTLEINTPFDALHYETSLKKKVGLLARKLLEKRLYNRDLNRYGSLLKKTRVITVSNHTKFSILSHFPEAAEELKVFYSPDVTEFELKTDADETSHFNMHGYFLLISGNRWLKNNLRSVMALDQLFSERKELQQNVIITGISNPEIFLKRIRNKNRFHFYKYVSEDFLQVLYRNAYAFLYMTLNEGFGYPPLESMKMGIPVITSPFTSIVEICGDAVLYSNPYSISEIKSRILQLTNTETYDGLVEAGKSRYQTIRQRQDGDLRHMVEYLSE